MLLVGSGQGDALTGPAEPHDPGRRAVRPRDDRHVRRPDARPAPGPVIVREEMGSEAVEIAVIEGHKKYDGEFEIRVGPGQGTETEGDPIGRRAE